jgi:hypothetical protein
VRSAVSDELAAGITLKLNGDHVALALRATGLLPSVTEKELNAVTRAVRRILTKLVGVRKGLESEGGQLLRQALAGVRVAREEEEEGSLDGGRWRRGEGAAPVLH